MNRLLEYTLKKVDNIDQKIFAVRVLNSKANKNSRIDFFLRLENIGIEVKKVRDKAHAKNLSDEIIDDKAKYSNNKEITELYFFIYDPNSYLLNREEFILDLEKDIPKFSPCSIAYSLLFKLQGYLHFDLLLRFY